MSEEKTKYAVSALDKLISEDLYEWTDEDVRDFLLEYRKRAAIELAAYKKAVEAAFEIAMLVPYVCNEKDDYVDVRGNTIHALADALAELDKAVRK